MKKVLGLIALPLILFSILATTPLLAIDDFCDSIPAGQEVPDYCQDRHNPTEPSPDVSIISTVLQIIIIVVAITSVIMIVISGFRMTITGGNPQSVGGARQSLIYALVGLVVALTAQLIVVFVINRL